MTYVFPIKPDDFSSCFDVVCCYVCVGDRVLALLRREDKSEGGVWCIPGGKAEAGEDMVAAVVREIHEETGLILDPEKLKYHGHNFVRYPDIGKDFIKHEFSYTLDSEPEVIISPLEHIEYSWLTEKELQTFSFVRGEDECMKARFGWE